MPGVKSPERALCGATKRSEPGATCKLEAGWGTSHPGWGHCRMHGGTSPTGEKYAIKQRAMSTLHKDVPRPEPTQALLDELWRASSVVAWLEDQVRQLGSPPGTAGGGGEGDPLAGLAQRSASGTSVPAFLVDLYGRERDRLAKVAALCVSSGIHERQVRVMEGQAHMLALALRTILAGLDLTPAQQQRAPGLVRETLLALPVGGGDPGAGPQPPPVIAGNVPGRTGPPTSTDTPRG